MNVSNPIETLSNCLAHATYEAFPLIDYTERDWEAYRNDKVEKLIKKTRKHTLYDLTVNAMFPQTWSSTALGFGGIGGQAFTSAYVCVIESNLFGYFAVYFGGRLAYVIKRPNEHFFKDIAEMRMEDSNKGTHVYERTN